jgi:hypothetical protein
LFIVRALAVYIPSIIFLIIGFFKAQIMEISGRIFTARITINASTHLQIFLFFSTFKPLFHSKISIFTDIYFRLAETVFVNLRFFWAILL